MRDGPEDTAMQVFTDHRGLLFSVVDNQLGSAAGTDDILKEAWLSLAIRNQKSSPEKITNPRAYLVRIAVDQALAQKADIGRRLETYIGPWPRESLATGTTEASDVAERAESVSMALRMVLGDPHPAGTSSVRSTSGVGLCPHRGRGHPWPSTVYRRPSAVGRTATRQRSARPAAHRRF